MNALPQLPRAFERSKVSSFRKTVSLPKALEEYVMRQAAKHQVSEAEFLRVVVYLIFATDPDGEGLQS